MLLEKSFNTGEITLNYRDFSESGAPLLLLHALTAAMMQEPFSVPLAQTWHVSACDFRGHGKSGRSAGQYHILDYRRDILAFLTGHFTEPAVLLGHALGALTAIAVASDAPELVRALVLLDPPLYLRNSPLATMISTRDWFSFVYETLKDSPSYEVILDRCRAAFPNDDETTNRLHADQLAPLDAGTVRVALQDQLLAGWNLESALENVTCPTLLLRGDWDHDAAVREADALDVRTRLPQVIDIKIPNAAHGFPWEQPDLTLEHVQTFLQSL